MNTSGRQQYGQVHATRLIGYGLVAIVLMALDHRGGYLDALRSAAARLTAPVYRVVETPFVLGDWLQRRLSRRGEMAARIEALERARARLTARLQRMASLQTENRELRQLLDAVQQAELVYIAADLVRVDLDPFTHRVVINRGREAGVRRGQAVVDAAGVLGQVSQVTASSAFVTLISDPDHALPVRDNRSGLRSIAYGTGDPGGLLLPDVPRNADVQVGDLLVTSGLGERFPSGLVVGEVTEVQRDPGSNFARVLARPAAALDRVATVLVVDERGAP